MYDVRVRTSAMVNADTSAQVSIDIKGRLGTTGLVPLTWSENHEVPFRIAQEDRFVVCRPYLGALTTLTIGHNGDYIDSSWHLDAVFVSDHSPEDGQKRTWTFRVGSWLSIDDSDSLWMTIPV